MHARLEVFAWVQSRSRLASVDGRASAGLIRPVADQPLLK